VFQGYQECDRLHCFGSCILIRVLSNELHVLDKTSLSIVENTDVYEVQKEYRTRDTGEISLLDGTEPPKRNQ